MQTSQPPLWARDHTLLGVCEALGEDFGFNPLFLRVPFAALLLVSPVMVIGAYAALAVLVMVSRWIAPVPKAAAPVAENVPAAAAAEAEAEMALAA
jgi:phage shock protein PspC (stress-responsive transcriptional regulator)